MRHHPAEGPLAAAKHRVADWYPIEAAWLAWPTRSTTWPGRIDRIKKFYGQWIAAIAQSTPVCLLVDPANDVPDPIRTTSNVTLVTIQTDDVWIRDYGPQWIFDHGELIAVGFEYNSWGGKYPPWNHDADAARRMAQYAGVRFEKVPMVLEGGAIEFDGQFGAMANQPCVIDDNRGAGATRGSVEQTLRESLGIEEMRWVDVTGPAGDDTDGHIDQIARYVSPNVIVVATGHPDCPADVAAMQQLHDQLVAANDSDSKATEIVSLPAVPPRRIDGQIVPQSYCNFQRLGPDRLLVPTFGVAADSRALAILREVTGADCEGVDCREMVYGLGALHCASNEQPKRHLDDLANEATCFI